MTEEAKAHAILARAHHTLTIARAKHRRAVDSAVALLSSALETLEADQQTEFSEYTRQCITSAISDLEKSKPEPGAWTE